MHGALPMNNNRGSFWWKDVLKSLVSFKGLASVIVSDGSSCLFWLDIWNNNLMSSIFPELFSFAWAQNISVQSFISTNNRSDLFHLPLSAQAFDQFQQLENFLKDFQLQNGNDLWTYIWGSAAFTSKGAYQQLIGSTQVHPVYKWL